MENNEQAAMAERIAKAAADALEEKKGLDVRVIPVAEQTVLADYFVIATGTSNTHVRALADQVEFRLKEALNVAPNHIEGYRNNIWQLMDYGSVIVHIFTAEGREYYNLERLWAE
ncbi:MAG: ribosome silencing factor [Clostridia bacterium]|nr:ribosome silencing factor [Clostridia bacterium]